MRDFNQKNKWQRVRMRLIAVFFALLLCASLCKAFYLQAFKSNDWNDRLQGQYNRLEKLVPSRGTIYDRNGAALAVSIDMDSVYAEPRFIKDLDRAAHDLSPLLGRPVEEVRQKLHENKNFTWLARRLEKANADRLRQFVKQHKLTGIGFVKETKRFYPNNEVAAHLLGFTGLDPIGLEGLEKRFDSTILGGTGYVMVAHDALGRDISTKGLIVKQSTQGDSLVLTIDKNIQYIAEKELAKAVAEFGAKGGIAIVMEPDTGRILAMANNPAFNPNQYSRYDREHLRNKAITDNFEPGSTFKSFLVASAIEDGVLKGSELFNCENGSYPIGGKVIHDTHKYGTLSVSEILKYSSNIGAAKIGSRMGAERLYNGLRNFGFGERTGIDLPGEGVGLLRDRKQWFAVDLATISFGQGVSVTPLQLLTAMSAIANGGKLMTPYLVEQIKDAEGNVVQQNNPVMRRQVVSEPVARRVAAMLATVTEPGGTGTAAAIPGYKVAGKTGTAQKVEPGTRAYSATKRIGSFVGFLPAEAPRIAVLVSIDEPTVARYGGVVAAPAFAAIGTQTLCYLKVPPQGTAKVTSTATAKGTDGIARLSAAPQVNPDNENHEMVPDFRGMSIRQALALAKKRGISIRITGSGTATDQSPAAASSAQPGQEITVHFTSPL